MAVELWFLLSTVGVLLLYAVYAYLTKNNRYFDGKPIPYLSAEPLFGNVRQLLLKQVSSTEFMRSLYDRFPREKVFGMFDFRTPVFVVRDPELIKRIAIKDFDHFVNHRPLFGRNTDPDSGALFAKTLFALTDGQWRHMRATLSPAFTGNKMRQMFDLITECSVQMVQHFRQQSSGTRAVYEMKEVFARFANDVIATCAFGLKVDSFRDANNAFFANGKQLVNFNRIGVIVKTVGYSMAPRLMERLEVDLFDREQTRFFGSIIRETVHRRRADGIVRPDMVHLLMRAQQGTLKHREQHEEDRSDEAPVEGFATVQESEVGRTDTGDRRPISDMELVAQCLIFFLAGFDAVSASLAFLSYELALNPRVQEKLHAEALATRRSLNGKPLTYDVLQRMKYMDMVVSESLRKWSSAPFVDRLCTRDYVLATGDDGAEVTIDKGTVVFIPISGIHHDPRYYPDPDRFDPERFGEGARDNITPGTYLPFGVGPRNCIGSRFALMEVKAIVYHLLLEFSFERCAETQVPPPLAKGFMGLGLEKGIHIEFRPRRPLSGCDPVC